MAGLARHLLVFETQTEGHHLSWLRYIAEDLLAAGARLTLALDQRPQAQLRTHEQLSDLLPYVSVIAARNQRGWIYGGGHADTVAFCQRQCGANHVFLACFDEIASHMLRRAAFGLLPPQSLRGCLGGICIRPKFLASRPRTPNQMLKWRGFQRLLKDGWLRQVLLLDENLVASLKSRFPAAPFHFLPDTCAPPAQIARDWAREQLAVPAHAQVFLFYGGPYKRKGLDLAIEAFETMAQPGRAFLLCVGQQPQELSLARRLERLQAAGRARAVNRYVSLEEEALAFAACDWVLLPYRKHFGSSGVLIRAACRGLPVIASDEELVGWRVREHTMGLLFASGDAAAFRHRIEQAAAMSRDDLAAFSRCAKKFSTAFTRAAFRQALLDSLAPI
jgi:glycosyltransferase involved in cell wall biosynthesis